MATTVQSDDRITLSRLDLRILVALLDRSMNGYEIARQCEADGGNTMPVNKSPLYHALASLQLYGLIRTVSISESVRRATVYSITPFGRNVLADELMWLQEVVNTARLRLRKRAKPRNNKKTAI